MMLTDAFNIREHYNSKVLALAGVFGLLREVALEPYSNAQMQVK